MITLFIFLIAQSPTGYHFLDAENKVYIASPEGLYRFDPHGPNLNRFTDAHGLAQGRIRFLAYDDGLVWVASDSGFANGDVRFNDWKVILKGEPLGIEFDDDYVYLAIKGQLYRFEKLTEDLEKISDQSGLLIRNGDKILIITNKQSLYYDLKSEEMSSFGMPAWLNGRYPIVGEGLIGVLNNNLAVKQRDGERWRRIPVPKINDFTQAGDSIIFATDSGLIFFDPRIGSVISYPWSYKGKVNGIARRTGLLAAATDSGIYVIGTGIKKESNLTGMPEDRVIVVHYQGDYLIAITENFIAFRNETGWQWCKREKGKVAPKIIYWDETGTYLVPFDHEIGFRGRLTYDYHIQHQSGNEYRFSDTTIDISANTELFRGRLSGFYNNTEPERIDYGIGYKSDHAIKKLFYGKDRFGLAQSQLTPTQQGIGAGGEIGGRVSIFGFHGQRIGTNRLDVFTGNVIEKQLTIKDSAYQSNRFFTIDTTEGRLTVKDLEIYYDDLDPLTNTNKTRVNYTIAGQTSDFDRLTPVVDYSYDEAVGVLDLKIPRIGIIGVRYDGKEIILDSTNMLKNRYWLGSNILPYSLDLTITDDLGQVHSIDRFGIDKNRDNRIDDQYIDFETGILRFPKPIINDTISYTLNLEYQTRSLLYQVSHFPIVRNSEKVYLDGEELRRGNDYIIDYSTGILLILKSETAGPGTEIEIHYEEELIDETSEIDQTGIQLRVRPTDQIRFGPGGYNSEGKTVLTLPFELRTGNLLLNTEVISDHKNYGGLTEVKLKKGGNYIKAKGDFVPDSIEDFGTMAAKTGRWIKKGEIGAGLEFYDLAISSEFRRGLARDSSDDYHDDERVIAMDLKPKALPYLTMKRGRREGFGAKKDFYRIETGHNYKRIRGRFGIGREYGQFSVNDIYSEINIADSRFYQRRTETEDYVSDRVEVSSFLGFIKGFIIKSNILVKDLYDKTDYTRFYRYLLLSSDISPWPFPLILKVGHGVSIKGFSPGKVSILARNPSAPHLKKEWPIIFGFEFTSRLILTSRTTVMPIYEREYSTTNEKTAVESFERGEYQLTDNSRVIGQYNLKNELHNQYLDYEQRIGSFILSPGVGANINEVKEIGPRLKTEFIHLPLLRIYSQNELFFAADYTRSNHSLAFLLNPIKPLVLRLTGALGLRTDTAADYSVGLRADGLF